MHVSLKYLVFCVGLLMPSVGVATGVSCASSYGIATSVDGVVANTICSDNSQDFIELVKNLKKTNPIYTNTSQVEIRGLFNNVDVMLNYAANEKTLNFSAPEININNMAFTGATRKEAERAFTDWLKKSGVIGDMMKYQSKHTAVSPITGAGGMMTTMATADLGSNFSGSSNISTDSVTNTQHTTSSNNTISSNVPSNVLNLGMQAGSYSVEGSDERVNVMTLPLSYSFDIKGHDGHKLLLSAPLTMYKVGSAKGYHLGLGVGYRLPINQQWSLTPMVRYALSGSADRATVASVMSGSLTSAYTFPVGEYDVSFANMVGYYQTGKFKAGDYSFDPNIKQTMLRNGLMLSQPIMLKGRKLAVEYSIIDTRYVGGNKPFLSNMQEYGLTIGLHKDEPKTRWSSLRGGVTYMNAKGVNGFTANAGYWF